MFMRRDQGDIYFSGPFPTLPESLASLGGDRCSFRLRVPVVLAQFWVLILGLQGKLLASEHLQLKKLRNALKILSNLIQPNAQRPIGILCTPVQECVSDIAWM